MKSACFIPIKENSERVPGKNFRLLNGKKLYTYICTNAKEAKVFDEIFIDSNSSEIEEWANTNGFNFIRREPYLASNAANGNDLLTYHYETYPQFDYYFQLFATAPFLQPQTIKDCYELLINSDEFDSCFTALKNHGFYWYGDQPINYRPGILPRSQDMRPVIEETTGLYGISASSLEKYRCRIGKKPYIHFVSKFEAVDINTEEDFKFAELVAKLVWNEENLK